MRDVVTTHGFVHLPPRERLVRHALHAIQDRVRPETTRAELEELAERFAVGGFLADIHEQCLDGRDVYHTRLWGKKVRVVFDVHYGSIVTVVPGWQEQRLRRMK